MSITARISTSCETISYAHRGLDCGSRGLWGVMDFNPRPLEPNLSGGYLQPIAISGDRRDLPRRRFLIVLILFVRFLPVFQHFFQHL
jgi:hypothetical protein